MLPSKVSKQKQKDSCTLIGLNVTQTQVRLHVGYRSMNTQVNTDYIAHYYLTRYTLNFF